ncbi:tetratricopeptide repeat protein [Perlabentimonas gracilis]|jgi:tetratricopeptide (TPR) repeat protein|uniref:tetratricopeptide repeat protein n=1 Tax=Perlabentimonas gracilis TaxID=2715279 RepID=UPI00140E52FB|nr:tetratricopeptide repeat protein [Perlabentimonas gracilis]NHB70119.1 tetratricopeptide repeat protein [Perlabentimonas gracilis]
MKTNWLNKILVVLTLAVAPYCLSAQTLKEATEAYNTGATLINEKKPEQAIEHLYRALEISEDLEYEGEETKRMVEDLIPTAHLQYAMNLYRAKDMYGALEQLEKAQETAKLYADRNTLGRVERIIPQLYNQMGNTEYRAENYEKAIDYYKKAIDVKADYPDPYLGIALAYEKQENFDSMLDYLKQTMEVSNAANDRKKAEDAQKKAKAYLLREGDEAQKAKRYEEAIDFLAKAIEFDDTDATLLYAIAVNYNELKNWGKVIEFGKLALEKANGSIDEAGVYYNIGIAFQNQGDTSQACQAFSNALSGSYRAAAEYQMQEVLKCQ